MWQRFTERARKVIFYSQEEAQYYGEGYVSTEHILLGLLRESDSVAGVILSRLGQDLAAIRDAVTRQLPRGEARPSQDMTLTPRAKRVIDLAYDEARQLNNNYIGTEHLLLGLVRENDGLAGRVLATAGVDLGEARAVTIQLQAEDPDRPSTITTPPPPPRQRTVDLRVRYDLRVLHPVDQMLIAILSDVQSVLGARLRSTCTSLDWLLPSIVGTMTQNAGGRGTLEQVVGEGVVDLESLYRACLRHTSAEVREVLKGLDLLLDEAE